LLRYVLERAAAGDLNGLKERTIGVELFGRTPDYDTGRDAVVRVAANEVRKRLAEYYKLHEPRTGRIELPVGSYMPVFVTARAPEAPEAPAVAVPVWRRLLMGPAVMAGLLFAMAAGVALVWAGRSETKPTGPGWPLAEVAEPGQRTMLVLADTNAAMLGLMRGTAVTLDEYLQPGFGKQLEIFRDRIPLVGNVIAGSPLTSLADATLAMKVGQMLGPWCASLEVRSARDLRMRDLQEGNFVFLGSPLSNPWVGRFAERMQFREQSGAPGRREFLNVRPRGTEEPLYRSFEWTGTMGGEYATIAVLPLEGGRGRALIVQGLHQEGTEAAFAMLTSRGGRERLLAALGVTEQTVRGQAFEVLLRFHAMAGVANEGEVVAVRRGEPVTQARR
jgi:hypothetical protein